jgi:hypothetical protein
VTILLSDLSGAGGLLKTVAFASARISPGASGDILTATAGVGQYLKLTYLLNSGATGAETAMTLTIDGVDIFSNAGLGDSDPSATANSTTFGVTNGYGNTGVSNSARLLQNVFCNSFTVTKVTGSTSQSIDYAYETMEAL